MKKSETLNAGSLHADGSVRAWPRWRIVTDEYRGYEVQVRTSYWKRWQQCRGEGSKRVNTFATIEEAREWANTKPLPPEPYRPFEPKVVEECKH